MRTSDFNYELPEELIAQVPIEDRVASRLLVVDRCSGSIFDKHFYDIATYLESGDTLVLNNSKVLPARIFGEKEDTGAKIEFLLHKQVELNRWEVMARPGKRLKIGTVVCFDEGLSATVLEKKEDGLIDVRFECELSLFEVLHKIGSMPLPPYIKEKLEDKDRYQTVYAKIEGSSAAPTAGLHFTNELIEKIKTLGVNVCYVTLHVGLGTFLPVSEDEIDKHLMHYEYYEISEETADLINRTKASGKKVVSVGTTCVRTLEASAENNDGVVKSEARETNIFIYPGFEFKVVDSIITNFHLPKSTLLMLVSAFYDREKMLSIYHHAVESKYRFFSFGDAMFISDIADK